MQRRDFLRLTAAGLGLAATARYSPTTFAADKVRRVGLIGCGWYGKSALFRLLQIEPVEVVSLCDVDQQMLAEAGQMVAERQRSRKTPRLYRDFREMLKERDLDLVQVSTPDHWHALPVIEAIKAGADIYCEKPTAVDVVESQAMLAAARKYNRVVQINTQRRSTPHLIEAREEVVKAGKLGRIGYVEICCYWGMGRAGRAPEVAPPSHLDYEMWTGPAPMRPFTARTHPRGWRIFMEYSNGILGDMCVHMLDMVRWMMDLGWPKTVSSTGGILIEKDSTSNTTDTQNATFDYGDLQVLWKHRTWSDMPDPDYPWAATFYGEKGTLKASVFKYEFFPKGQKQPAMRREALLEYDKYPEDRTEKDLERHVAAAMRGHWRNLLECVDRRARPVADIEEGHISSAACFLANLSQRLGGRTLVWDPATHRCVGDAEANALLARPYRAPWVHPDPATV
ncbi:MAG: Gfo/Idh/MocA family oxidoreductase [Verrucomicrobia bacterium]|nr:Gfo/Idh/MocA family oxidoreductase [Verrucomicrobiota bacterium]